MKNTQRPTPKIPEGMVELLKNLAKSVLKEQPENIYVFAAEYFENLVRQRDGGLDKGYSTFRKYDDEISKQDGFVCPRCHYVLHPDRREVDSANDDDEGVSPKNDDTNGLDMSVNGVAIKAVPRDGKITKGPKNRQRLETIRSVSMDSAIEDDGKSQATSPKSNENVAVKSVDRHLSVPNLNALKPINVSGVSIPAKIHEEVKSEQENEITSKSSAHDVAVEPTSATTATKTTTDDDIDLSTNEISASDANTDRTVIEVAPLNTEGKTETEITTVITEPTDEQTVTVEQTDQIKSVNNLHLDQVKQMDQRLRTPESDSGLSEKSFNLNIQENEDAVTAERNQIKDGNEIERNQERDSNDSNNQNPPNGKDFDTESKDDSGIVEFEENPNENESEEMTNENENRDNVENANKSVNKTDNLVKIQSPDEDKSNEQKNDSNQNLDQNAVQIGDKQNVATNETTTEQKSEQSQPERPNTIALHTNLKPQELVEQYHKSPERTSKTFEDHVLNHMKATSPMVSDETAPTFENIQNNDTKPTDSNAMLKMASEVEKIASDDKSDPQLTHPTMNETKETENTSGKKDDQSTNDSKFVDGKKFPEKSIDENQFPVEACDLAQPKSAEEKPSDKNQNELEMKNSSKENEINSPNEPLNRNKRDISIENDDEKPNNGGTEQSRVANNDSNLNAKSETDALKENKGSEMKENAQNAQNTQDDVKIESTVAKPTSVENSDILKGENHSKIENESVSEQPKQSNLKLDKSQANTEQTASNSQDEKDETNTLGSTKSEKPLNEQNTPEIASNVSEKPSESGPDSKTTDSIEQSDINQTKNETAKSTEKEQDKPNEDHKSPSIENADEKIKSEDLANKSLDTEKGSVEKAKEENSVEGSDETKPSIDQSTVLNESNSQGSNEAKSDEKSNKVPSEQPNLGISPSPEQLSAVNITENDNKETEVKSGKQSANEKSEMQLDLNGQDEISDDVYITPPETSNDHTSAERTKSSEKVFPESNADIITNEVEMTSKVDLPANENVNELNTSKSNDIENGNLNSVKPENGHLVDEVKESQTAAKYVESNSGGVNESNSEKSAMPAEGVDVVENKAKENQGTSNNNNENIQNNNNNGKNDVNQASNENENLGKNIERKISIEQEQSNEHENENENDDAVSELSASAKDEYEKADTEIVGDESVKDLDLSSTNDLDANLANESAESEQQITALEIPQQNDNDSIDSSPKQNQMQPDSLDMLADSNIDSLDVSLEPSVEADSLNIDSLDEKTKSAKSTGTRDSTDSNRHETIDEYDEKDSTNEQLKHDNHGNDNNHNKSHAQSTTDQATKNDSNKLDVSTEQIDSVEAEQTAEVMGDIVDVDSQQQTDTMHAQMRNELEVLRLAEKSASIVMLGVEEVKSPKSTQPTIVEIEVESKVEPVKDEVNTTSDKKPENVEIIEKVETMKAVNKPEGPTTEIKDDMKDAAEIHSKAETEQTIEIIIQNPTPDALKEDIKIIDDTAKFDQTVEVVIENQSNLGDVNESNSKAEGVDVVENKANEIRGTSNNNNENIRKNTIETQNEIEQKVSNESEMKDINSTITEGNSNEPMEISAVEIVHSVEISSVDDTIGVDNLQKLESQIESSNTDSEIVVEKSIEKIEKAEAVESSEKIERNKAEETSLNKSKSKDSIGTKAEEKLEKELSEQLKSEINISVAQSSNDLKVEKDTKEPETDQVKSEDQANQEINHDLIDERLPSPEESSKDDESINAVDMSIITEITIEQSIDTDEQIEIIESSLTVYEAPETERSEEAADTEPLTCVEYLKPISNDTPSSDLSDTDTTDKAEKAYTESGVDESSRDERDEVSEIENFDLSSCGEDSLEAMYYMIRKNEIIMDRHKQTTIQICEEEKIIFPDKATDDLEHAVREVSGKKITLCSIGGSMTNSSTDDVVLKKLSSDSDEIQLHVIPNSEIDSSSSDLKSCPLKEEEQCTANESTDDEYMNPILDSMRKNDNNLNGMQAKAFSVQPNRSDSPSDDQQQTETDTFNEHLMDDMMRGNIERKILASSVSEADSDYFEMPPTTSRLTKDDFNVSTAFEHMIRAESTTEDSDSTIESAATKIQATARGFITRRRLRRSSAGTSASIEKRSSIGNAAIDKSLDNLIEQQEMVEENAYSESFEESPAQSREMLNDPTIDSIDSDNVLGITEIKVEQRKDDTNEAGNYDDNDDDDDDDDDNNDHANAEKVPGINIQGVSEESATAQRRLMLQRGDAMQRNDTPESSEQQQPQQQQQPPQQTNDKEKSNNGENLALNENNNSNTGDDEHVKTPTKTTSKPIAKALRALGPRQRSMPVQIDTQVMRVLPKHSKKRVQSANSASPKQKVKRPQLF